MTAILPLVAFAVLTAANAFFVAAEFALVTVDRAAVQTQVDAGDSTARTVRDALRELSFQLSGTQVGITISALLAGYLAEPALARLFRPVLDPMLGRAAPAVAVAAGLGVATLVSMLFGELIPKNVAIARPMRTARLTAGPMRVFARALRGLIRTLNGAANWAVRRMGVQPQEELASARSPEELGLLAAYSARAGAIAPETAMLLQRTIRFGDKRAAEAMTPRVDVVAVAVTEPVEQVLRTARDTGKSRFPVYEGTLDTVVGVVTVIDALSVPPGQRASTLVGVVAHEPVLVPGSLDLDGVLVQLKADRADLAIVVDEYGGTDGVVTLEDLVEELVGEISDEYDQPEPPPAAPVGGPGGQPREWLVDGVTRADELAEQTGFTLPDGPYETLAGFVLAQLGKIPESGARVDYGGWSFVVRDVQRRRIEAVSVRAPEPEHG